MVKVRGSSDVVLHHKVSRNGIVFDDSILDTDANDVNMWTPREVFPPKDLL